MNITWKHWRWFTICSSISLKIWKRVGQKNLRLSEHSYESEPVTFTDEPCVLHWPEAMEILREKGFDMGDGLGDLTGAQELALGTAVKEKLWHRFLHA